jgi:glycosylphosphatidylinositol transamidase
LCYFAETYFSENALLPGLVVEHFGGGHRAEFYLKELQRQDATEEKVTPDFIYTLLRDVGLAEVEIQNFTLIDPVTKRAGDSLKGKNVYAIHRAKRAAGTEALVFNVPFFSRNGANRRNFAAIALMLSLAEYFQSN